MEQANQQTLDAEIVISLVDEQSRLINALGKMGSLEKNIAVSNLQEVESKFNSMFNQVQQYGGRSKVANDELQKAKQKFDQQL